jgi:hypothetical protein
MTRSSVAPRYVFATSSGNDQVNGFAFTENDRLALQGQTFTLGTSVDGDVLPMLFGAGTIELVCLSRQADLDSTCCFTRECSFLARFCPPLAKQF